MFINEFKELCVRQSNQGMTSMKIFDSAGSGYHLIGENRTKNNVRRFKEQSQRSKDSLELKDLDVIRI